MGTFKDLVVWQKSMDLARKVYILTKTFPREEVFGLVSQMNRCSVSIPSNIAEGFGRESANEHIHFLYIALGSSNELGTQLILSHDFHFIDDTSFQEVEKLNAEVGKMLAVFAYKLRKQSK